MEVSAQVNLLLCRQIFIQFTVYVSRIAKSSRMSSVSRVGTKRNEYSYILLLCTLGVIVLQLPFPQSSDWTHINQHEALVALSNWRNFLLTRGDKSSVKKGLQPEYKV